VRVLLIGRGGREHAMAWALARSPNVEQMWVAPGNNGTTGNVALAEDDQKGLIAFARANAVSLAVVGPEAPLAAGLADAFRGAGIACFGPSKAAARLESSKAFAKDFMRRHNIPTARYAVFRELEPALAYLRGLAHPVVVKASGLAAGKGVVIPQTNTEAEAVLHQMLLERSFGSASDEVVIEERLEGPEISIHAFCDGARYAIMPAAQDHKRIGDGDQGPNTGGMGAYAPAPIATEELLAEIRRTILEPTLAGMAAEGAPFSGVLYPGLMLTKDGPRVIEFNCRFGDPETQVILPLLEGDFAQILADCAAGQLDPSTVTWRKGSAVAVVAASGGYPGSYAKGHVISGLAEAADLPGTLVFYAGVKPSPSGSSLTDGGRVLAVTGLGANVAEARARAYAGIKNISFQDIHYRHDIGARALEKEAT